MQPIILITVYRRYHELVKNLETILGQIGEFEQKPHIFVVWVNPEVGRLWIFKKLVAEGKISHVITRLTDNDGSISYEESRNILKGLHFIQEHYKNYFVVVQTADISPNPGVYTFIQKHIKRGKRAVLFHMDNGVIHHDIWHTNFFAVTDDDRYYPPYGGGIDILERQWGKYLVENRLDNFEKNHNYNNKKFYHRHESEELPEFLFFPQNKHSSVILYMKGRPTVRYILRRVYKWLKSWLVSIRILKV